MIALYLIHLALLVLGVVFNTQVNTVLIDRSVSIFLVKKTESNIWFSEVQATKAKEYLLEASGTLACLVY